MYNYMCILDILYIYRCICMHTYPYTIHRVDIAVLETSSSHCPRKYILDEQLLQHVQTVIQPVMIEAACR